MIIEKIGSLLGDLHTVRAICIPPCFQIGEHKRQSEVSNEYRILSKILRVGDVLVSRSWGYLSNSLIKGAFKHAMVYTGPVSGHRTSEGFVKEPKLLPSGFGIHQTFSPRTITHAISEGVVCQDLLDVMLHCDYLAVFRPCLLKQCIEDCGNIIAYSALEKVGKPYDFGFDFSHHGKFSCTEMVNYCCKKAGLAIPPQIYARTPIKKRKVTFADHYFGLYPLVYVSPQCLDVNFVRKSSRPNALLTAMRMVK